MKGEGAGCNRWLDKSLSLIVSKEGRAGVNFEHSWGDGIAVLRYMTEVHEDIFKYGSWDKEENNDETQSKHDADDRVDNKIDKTTSSSPTSSPLKIQEVTGSGIAYTPELEQLFFTLNPEIKSYIAQAKESAQQLAQNLSTTVHETDIFNRKVAANINQKGDSFIQCILQLAWYRSTQGHVANIYESASTAGYKHGRTENVRPLSIEQKHFVEAMSSNNPANVLSNAEKRFLLEKAIKVHSERAKAAVMGQGFDRHLFAMKEMSNQLGTGLGREFFDEQENSSYKRLNEFDLSTTSIYSDAIDGGSFGPVVDNGLGVAYGMNEEAIRLIITGHNQEKGTGITGRGTDYQECLQQAFQDVLALYQD